MKLKEIQRLYQKTLKEYYDIEEINTFFFICTEFYYQIKRIDLAMQPDIVLKNTQAIFKALRQLKAHKPIQYIIGETEFYGLLFKVNKNVLIPRPETEALVSWIINSVDTTKPLKILDIGTGSGCIAIALAKHLKNAKIYGLDVSNKALKVAKQNAIINNTKVVFIKHNILENTIERFVNFDIIVSNPPYIRTLEKKIMKPNVLENEPHLALFVADNNPLQFYKAIVQFSKTALLKNGFLFFEINEFLGHDVVKMMASANFNTVELKQDIFGKDRMVKGKKV